MLIDWPGFSMTYRTVGPSRRETGCGPVLEQDAMTDRVTGVQVRIRHFKHGLAWALFEKRRSDRLNEFSCRIRRSGRLYLPVKWKG
jgi:hypothetical protein